MYEKLFKRNYVSNYMPKLKVKIIKIGNSLGVRLPKNVLSASGIREGDRIDFEFEIQKPKVKIRKTS